MRMRKLGNGQSIVFCIPSEIEAKILARTSKPSASSLEVADVLIWTIIETCEDLRRSIPLWATQGMRYEEQKISWDAARIGKSFQFSPSQAQSFLEDEAQTLETRYRPNLGRAVRDSIGPNQENDIIDQIVDRCREFDVWNMASKSLQEEQERELSPEIERERQVEMPDPAEPMKHRIHEDILILATTGKVKPGSTAFMYAFDSLASCTAAVHLKTSQIQSEILVTTDFRRTVKPLGMAYKSDAHQRPVQWVISSTGCLSSNIVRNLIIISPFEAQELLPIIEKHNAVTLHLYATRPSLEFQPLDSLDLFTVGKHMNSLYISRSFVAQLNLFAGQVYLSTHEDYFETRKFLGLEGDCIKDLTEPDNDRSSGVKGSSKNGLRFFQILHTKIRRNCESISKTHLGRIMQGEILCEKDFSPQRI
jgi:hypothetical protein